jgi:hypothetical protein
MPGRGRGLEKGSLPARTGDDERHRRRLGGEDGTVKCLQLADTKRTPKGYEGLELGNHGVRLITLSSHAQSTRNQQYNGRFRPPASISFRRESPSKIRYSLTLRKPARLRSRLHQSHENTLRLIHRGRGHGTLQPRARRLLKNPRTSRVSHLGQISVEGRRSIP